MTADAERPTDRQCPYCRQFTLADQGGGLWYCGACDYDCWDEGTPREEVAS